MNFLKSFFKPKYDPSRFDSLISSETQVAGPITYAGSLKVMGTVMGTITPTGSKTSAVTVSGLVRGDIIADFVVIEKGGQVYSNSIKANVALIIRNGGQVHADLIEYGDIELDKGSIINGKMQQLINAVAVPVQASGE